MHVNTKKLAFSGLLAAFAVVLLVLSSVIETSSLFFIVAAAFCVGIVLREWGIRTGMIFLSASFLVGLVVAPNRLYCITFFTMGIYLILGEILWEKVADSTKIKKKVRAVWIGRYLIFNCLLIPTLIFFPSLVLTKDATEYLLLGLFMAAQVALFVFEKAYLYFQVYIWGKFRNKILK